MGHPKIEAVCSFREQFVSAMRDVDHRPQLIKIMNLSC